MAAPEEGVVRSAGSALLRLVGRVIVVAAVLVATWVVAYASGGARGSVPQLFYLAVILAALLFAPLGAMVTAILAGILAGPMLPEETSTGAPQETWSWGMRTVVFVVVAAVVARLHRHSSLPASAILDDLRLRRSLRHGLRRGQVQVHYQPILDLRTGVVTGVEALARWTHPLLGSVSPARFVPMAERTGLVVDLDRYVLRQAIRQARAWRSAGRPLTISVNISATRCADPGLVADVERALGEAGLPPERLQLEITETAVIRDPGAAAEQIRALREHGVRIAIDDFGAGQTSLSYFNEFVVDTVKIDRSFVVRAIRRTTTARLLGGLIELFGSMDTQVVAEGISTPQEYVELRMLGCPSGQGFYLGLPVPGPELERMLNTNPQFLRRET